MILLHKMHLPLNSLFQLERWSLRWASGSFEGALRALLVFREAGVDPPDQFCSASPNIKTTNQREQTARCIVIHCHMLGKAFGDEGCAFVVEGFAAFVELFDFFRGLVAHGGEIAFADGEVGAGGFAERGVGQGEFGGLAGFRFCREG